MVPERRGTHNKSRSSDIMSFNITKALNPVRVWVPTQLQHLDYRDERHHLGDLTTKCEEVDLIIYCLKMTETWLTSGDSDEVAMGKLFKAL